MAGRKKSVEVETKQITKEGNKSKLIHMQDILFKTLDTLNNDKEVEIQKCNTIAKVSSTVINSIKTNIAIMELAEKYETTTDNLNNVLGL